MLPPGSAPAKQTQKSLLVILVLLVGVIVSTSQFAVGEATIYRDSVVPNREFLHYAILNNRRPGPGWESLGAAKMNVRIGAVYLAESIHQTTNIPLFEVYRALDSLFLAAFLLGLFWYLRRWVPDLYALLGVMFVGLVLPLTYLMHYFHPEDRLQLCMWLLVLHALRDRQPILLAGALSVSMLVKFDALFVPALYLMSHLTRQNAKQVILESTLLGLLVGGIYVGMDVALNGVDGPARFGVDSGFDHVLANVESLSRLGLNHPPLLMHGLLLLLALVRLRTRDRMVFGGVVFAGMMSTVWFVFSVYAEVRPQTMLVLLLLPPALLTLREEFARAEGVGLT